MSCLPSEGSIYPAPENCWCFCSWFTVDTHISPQKADLLRHGGQGTLCPIDLKSDESLQASFKLSWAARHCHQLRMLRPLTNAGSYRVCTWPGQQITVMGAQLPPHLEKSGLSGQRAAEPLLIPTLRCRMLLRADSAKVALSA